MSVQISTKVCICCKLKLPTDEFFKKVKSADGLMPYCKKCGREKHKQWRDRKREHLKEYRERTKDKRNARRRELYASDPKRRQRACESARQYRLDNPRSRRKSDLQKYNLGLEEYDQMLESQNGQCAICGKRQHKKLFVDHNHKTGKVRGLLCNNCNFGIGQFQDDFNLLLSAIEYLRRHNE